MTSWSSSQKSRTLRCRLLSRRTATLPEGDNIAFYAAEGERVAVAASRVGVVAAERLTHAAFMRYSAGASISIVQDALDHDLIHYYDTVGTGTKDGGTRTGYRMRK